MEKALLSYLKKYHINYKIHKHPPVFTVEESKKIKQKIPGLSTKSLFLKDENNNYYLISLPGEKRLNIGRLKKYFLIKELIFASPEELFRELHVMPGSVSIFAIIYSNKTILALDNEVWDAKIVGFHPNINTETLELTHDDLKRFYDSVKAQKHIIALNDAL
ncbi:MAG: YbaK/EbsC family protein [Nanoarchaeota archaeon]